MFLEALNVTGIPSYFILAAIGYLTNQSSLNFFVVFLMTLLGSVSGCVLYYGISLKFGRPMYDYFYRKFPATQRGLNKASTLSEKYGPITCFLGRIIPTVRTFISLMAGVFQLPLNPTSFIHSSGFHYGISLYYWLVISLLPPSNPNKKTSTEVFLLGKKATDSNLIVSFLSAAVFSFFSQK